MRQGTNLKAGAKALLQRFSNVKCKYVIDRWSSKEIGWRHIVSFTPSKDGNWERLFGLSKNLISAIAARDYYRSIITEELTTYFKEVEVILNWTFNSSL